jgi:hypothetical protein
MSRTLSKLFPFLVLGAAMVCLAWPALQNLRPLDARCADIAAKRENAAQGAGTIVVMHCSKQGWQEVSVGTAIRLSGQRWVSAQHVVEPDDAPLAPGERQFVYLVDTAGKAHLIDEWVAHPDYDIVAFNAEASGEVHKVRDPLASEQLTALGPGRGKHLPVQAKLMVSDPLHLRRGRYVQLAGLVRPGYSGGPILGADGAVVAMSYAISNDERVTWAVPASAIKQMSSNGVIVPIGAS